MIKLIIGTLLILIIVVTIIWLYVFRDPCGERECKNPNFTDDGFGRIDNFLSQDDFDRIRDHFVKSSSPMYNTNTIILGNPRGKTLTNVDNLEIVNFFTEKVEKLIGKKLYVDYAFLRYYDGKAVNPFEFYHLDSKHYNHKSTQIRALFNIYDKSEEGTFCYKSKCCENGKEYCMRTQENTLTFIQANKLVHKYEYKGGERLVFVIDFTTSYERGLYGSVWGFWDFVWDRIQKSVTSTSATTFKIIIIIIIIIVIVLLFLLYRSYKDKKQIKIKKQLKK